jgi:putative FmdB family regulatory protein
MPLYEYRCQSCGRTREALQKMGDPPLKTCEDCGGELKRLVSAPAVQFKGTGWYVTDYAKKSGDGGRPGGAADKDKGGSAEKGASSGEGGSSSSSDSAGTAEKIPAAEKSSAADKPAAAAASSSAAPSKES